jgi:cyclopropane fatty-acyl-phospholipid synthase-like methyltransferase
MGYANRLHYYQTGYETYRMLDDALADFAGRRMSDFSTVVDWGCGCGRLTQHLIARTPATVFGLDIDRENVAWCRENLRPAQFEVVGLAPPTQLPKARADLVIGISVFTHLHEEAQDQWLDEIRRLLRPDGIALLTIRSLHSFCTGAISTARYHNFITRGIDDAPIGHTLDDILKSDEFPYYRETSHSYEYISKRWGAYFDIVGINAGAHLNYQDLVIARKRTGGGETAPVSKY